MSLTHNTGICPLRGVMVMVCHLCYLAHACIGTFWRDVALHAECMP